MHFYTSLFLVMISDEMNNTTKLHVTSIVDIHLEHSIILVMFYMTIALMSIVANGIVVAATYFITNRSCGTKICLQLSLSHLVSGSIILTLQGQGDTWLLQNDLCIFKLVVSAFWRISIILFTFLATLESYVNTRRHLKRDQTARTPIKDWSGTKITIIWLCSLAIGLFSFFLSFKTNSKVCISFQHSYKALVQIYYGFIFWMLLSMFFVNVLYVRLYKRQLQIQGVYQSNPPPDLNKVELRFSRCSFKLFHVIVLLWLPYLIYAFCLSSIGSQYTKTNEKSYQVLKVCHLTTFLSSLLQPSMIIRYNEEYGVLLSNMDQIRRKLVRIKKTTPHSGALASSGNQFDLKGFDQSVPSNDREKKRSICWRVLATVDQSAVETNC